MNNDLESLRNSEALYHSLVEALPQFIFRKDRAGRFTFVSPRFCRLLGKAEAEILGKTDFDFYPPELAEKYHRDDSAVLRTGEAYEAVEAHQTPQGAKLFMHVVKTPLRDAEGNLIGVQGIFWDETARHQAEQQIQEQAELLSKVHDAVSVQDVSGHWRYWNHGAEVLYGWKASEVWNQPAEGLLNEAGDQIVVEARGETLRTGFWNGELKRITKTGQTVVVQSRWSLVRQPEGNPKSILCVETDVTERKNLEAEFLRAQRLESIGRLASGIAHDLNNILTPIQMSAGILAAKPLDEETKEMMMLIRNCAQRGSYFVKQLLTFARGMGGERLLVQPKHLIGEVMKMARQTFPKSIEVQIQIADDLWAVSGNPTELHQVLLNICVNARDAMPEGGRLVLAAENVQVEDHSAKTLPGLGAGAYVLLTVTDTGHGIAPEIMDRIFDPFFSTKEPGQGTGLGLSTVLGIVRNHGGFVKVDSTVGKGSAFKIYLPAKPASVAPSEAGAAEEAPRGNGELVLLVDDEAVVLGLTQTVLKRYGYQVLTARNGSEALALYQQHQHQITLVLTDLAMPVMDGIALIRSLRRLSPRLCIIAATGLGSAHWREALVSSGVRTWLQKPYAADKLLLAIHDNLPAAPAPAI